MSETEQIEKRRPGRPKTNRSDVTVYGEEQPTATENQIDSAMLSSASALGIESPILPSQEPESIPDLSIAQTPMEIAELTVMGESTRFMNPLIDVVCEILPRERIGVIFRSLSQDKTIWESDIWKTMMFLASKVTREKQGLVRLAAMVAASRARTEGRGIDFFGKPGVATEALSHHLIRKVAPKARSTVY